MKIRFYGSELVSLVIVSLAFAAGIRAQSTDMDSPTPMTTNVVTGEGDGKGETLYYGFTSTAGDVKVTVDAKTDKYSTPLEVTLLTSDGKELLQVTVVAGDKMERKVATRHFVREQNVILRISTREDNEVKLLSYKITLDGAVQFAPAPQAQTDQTQPTSTTTPQSATVSTMQGENVTGQTDAQPTADTPPATTIANSALVTSANDAPTQSNTTDTVPVDSATPMASTKKSHAQKVQSAIDSASSASGSIFGVISSTKESLKGVKPASRANAAAAGEPNVVSAADPNSVSVPDSSGAALTASQGLAPQPVRQTSVVASNTNSLASRTLPARPTAAQVSTSQLPVRTASLLPVRQPGPTSQNQIAPARQAVHLKPNSDLNVSPAASAEGRMATPRITVRSERVSVPKRTGYVIAVTNWNEFKINKFVPDTRGPRVLPPSPCDQSTGFRFVARLYTDDGSSSVCHNLASSSDLMEIGTTVATGTSLKGFYLVITDLQSGQSVRSNIAAIAGK